MNKNFSVLLFVIVSIGLVGCKSGWVSEGDNWYYYSNGKKVVNNWIEHKYYVDSNGVMLKNVWIEGGGMDGIYLLGSEGKLATNTWINSVLPIYNTTYKMYTGEMGGIYYINSNSEVATDTWIDDKYYVDSSGNLVTDTWVDDKYYVDSNGVYDPNKTKPDSNNSNAKNKNYDIESVEFEGSYSNFLNACLSALEDDVKDYIAGNFSSSETQKRSIEINFNSFVETTLILQDYIQSAMGIDINVNDDNIRDLSKAKEVIKFYRSMFTFLR